MTPTPLQPFINLVQANMALLARHATSPEAMSQAMSQAQKAFTEGPAAMNPAGQSGALVELAQGMLENYTRFLTELSQSGMAMMMQGPAAMLQSGQDAAGAAGEERGGRRGGRS